MRHIQIVLISLTVTHLTALERDLHVSVHVDLLRAQINTLLGCPNPAVTSAIVCPTEILTGADGAAEVGELTPGGLGSTALATSRSARSASCVCCLSSAATFRSAAGAAATKADCTGGPLADGGAAGNPPCPCLDCRSPRP